MLRKIRNMPIVRTHACTTGKSRCDIAWSKRRPTPGSAKTSSITTTPPSRKPNCRPAVVIIGILALGRAWLKRILISH